MLTKGDLQDSYFEFGWGKNDVFADFGPRADSIQSFFGVDIDIFDAWGN